MDLNEAWQRLCVVARPSRGLRRRGQALRRAQSRQATCIARWNSTSSASDLAAAPSEREAEPEPGGAATPGFPPSPVRGRDKSHASVLVSNPVALRRAVETAARAPYGGTRNPMRDLKEGRLSMVDAEAFSGRSATSPSRAQVVYRNKLIELIQYEPKSETRSSRVPLLILPPWIKNKYLLLDLQRRTAWCAAWSTAFAVWCLARNPDTFDERHRHGLCEPRPAHRGARDHGQPDGECGGLLHRGHAAGHDAGLVGGEGQPSASAWRRSWCQCRTFSRVGETRPCS